MTSLLLRICAADRCSSALSNEYLQLTQSHNKALIARAAAAAAARLRRFRAADRASPSTPLQKRRKLHGCHSLVRLLRRRLDMATHHEIRRRSSAADRAPADPLVAGMATISTFAATPDFSRASPSGSDSAEKRLSTGSSCSVPMPPPPPPSQQQQPEERSSSRHSRHASTASRNANRLSLTLPVARPTGDPSRPVPTSATSTVPPTPADSYGASPSESSDLIIAIAAQERKVLELREELSLAEADLSSLKKQWTASGHFNGPSRGIETPRSVAPSPIVDENTSPRRSVEIERRRSLLQNQNTPTQNRRRVLRGGHTRTLSLLSPAKTSSTSSLPGPEEVKRDSLGLPHPPVERRSTMQISHPNLSNRASWQPRVQQHNGIGVPQLVEDFRSGLRAFVEDIRQITVGDEPISGQSPRPAGALRRSESISLARSSPRDQETIRASHVARPKVSTVFDTPDSVASPPTPSNAVNSQGPMSEMSTPASTKEAAREFKAKSGKSKHFSWTPLSLDSVDDSDWSNWESPSPTKSTRWSGSTIHSGPLEDIQSIPERAEESLTPSKSKSANLETPILSPKLEEIFPNVVNRLSPSNIKRTANNLMTEWEKSLVAPEDRDHDKENAA